jgi:hypothetical protein
VPWKGWIPTHRGHSSTPESQGLSEARRALVYRYMTGEEVVPVQPQRFGTPEGSPHTMEQSANPTATARNAGRATKPAHRGATEEVDGPKAVARADKRAAKQAARRIAALEKKEARERKALAKAARRKRA